MKKSNVRHLTTALAATSFLVSSSSYALGIGDMKLQSALNQNLQAEIALILSDEEKAVDFKVGLAPNAKFDEAGIPWTLFLSKIKFQAVTKNGKTFIKLSSTEVLKEPFLDFLLEIKSAKGSLYREFTILIDPPAAYHVAAETLPPPVVQTASELPQRFISALSEITSEESNYGPTRQNETLWSIAAQFNKQNNVSIERMLAAIYIANPEAFSSKKTDSLIVGRVLKIPTFAKSPLLFAAASQEHVSKPTAPKLVRVAKQPHHEKPAKSEPVTIESAAMQQKMTDLEKQLAAMKKTIAEKETQIITSKPSSTTTKSEPTIKPELAAKPVPVAPSIPNPVAPITTPVAPVIQTVLPPPVSAPVIVPQTAAPILEAPTQPIAVLPPTTLPAVITTPPSVVTPTLPVTPTPVITTTSDNYFGIPADLYYYVAGGVGSLLLGLLALLRLRERNKTTDVTTEIITTSEETETKEDEANISKKIEDSSSTMFDDSFDMDNMEFENFAASEFSDFINNDPDKHDIDDILYKADIYCAYGNNEQAEKLLFDEFIKNPQAHDYALRLLKLYEAQDNKIEFKNFILELVKLGKNDLPDFWVQVSDIAAEFYPEALFFTPPPAIPNPLTSIPFDEMFASVNLDEKFDDSIDFDSMSFDDADDKEITFGELSPEETLSSADVTDLFTTPAAIPIASTSMDQMFANEITNQKSDNGLNFGSMGFDDPDDKEITFGELTHEETLSSADVTDFFGELSDNTPITFEFDKISITEKEESALDFSSFEMNESLETKPTVFEIPTEELALDFSAFALDSQPEETPAEDMTLDFSAFALDSKSEHSEELALDFNAFVADSKPESQIEEHVLNFVTSEPFKDETTTFEFTENPSETKTVQEEPELVMVDFPFEKQEAATFKQSFTFEKVNDLVEENGMRTYLDLTKVPENEDEHLEYLDMSDSQFAELLVAEMLKKHQIKERLCRQKIVQEVLDKLR